MYTKKQAEQEAREYLERKQEEDRAAYQKKRRAISPEEVKQAQAILDTPRVAAAGLEIVKRYEAGDRRAPISNSAIA